VRHVTPLAAFVLMGCTATVTPFAPDPVKAPEPPRHVTATMVMVGDRRLCHDALVTAVGLSRDRLATGADDGAVTVYGLDGRALRRLRGDGSAVRFVGFLEDDVLVTASDGHVRVGDMEIAGASPAAVTLVGRRLACACADGSVAVIDSGLEIARFREPGVEGMALSWDGDVLATVTTAGIVLREVATGRRSAVLSGEPPIAFLPDGRLAFSRSSRNRVFSTFAVDVESEKHLEDLSPAAVREEELVAGDATAFASAAAAFASARGDIANGETRVDVVGQTSCVARARGWPGPIALSPDARLVAAATDHGVTVFDARDGHELVAPEGHVAAVVRLEFSSDSRTLVSASAEGRVFAWKVDHAASPAGRAISCQPWTASAGPFGPFALVAPGAPAAQGISLLPLPPLCILGSGWIVGCAVSPSGDHVAWLSATEGVSLQVAATGVELWENWPKGAGPDDERVPFGRLIAFTADERTLVVNRYGALCAFDVATGTPRNTLNAEGLEPVVRLMTWAYKCKGFGTPLDGLIWYDGERVQPRDVKLGASGSFADFSPDGSLVALGGERTIPICDARTGAVLVRLDGHARETTALAFSPDGRSLASGDASGALRVWLLDAR